MYTCSSNRVSCLAKLHNLTKPITLSSTFITKEILQILVSHQPRHISACTVNQRNLPCAWFLISPNTSSFPQKIYILRKVNFWCTRDPVSSIEYPSKGAQTSSNFQLHVDVSADDVAWPPPCRALLYFYSGSFHVRGRAISRVNFWTLCLTYVFFLQSKWEVIL